MHAVLHLVEPPKEAYGFTLNIIDYTQVRLIQIFKISNGTQLIFIWNNFDRIKLKTPNLIQT